MAPAIAMRSRVRTMRGMYRLSIENYRLSRHRFGRAARVTVPVRGSAMRPGPRTGDRGPALTGTGHVYSGPSNEILRTDPELGNCSGGLRIGSPRAPGRRSLPDDEEQAGR